MAQRQEQKTHEEHIAEIWKMFKESRQAFEKSKIEADRQTEELKLQMQDTDRLLNKFIGGGGNRWGAIGENLAEGKLVKRLKEKGIEVERIFTDMTGPKCKFDIIAVNDKEVIVVEVKSTLDLSDVDEFIEKLNHFKAWCPEYKDKTIYGAMAFSLSVNDNADKRAEKFGLFAIKATGNVIIKNKENFKPKAFS